MLMQSVDFLELERRFDCLLQMGGSDQWGNIVNGVELIRRVEEEHTATQGKLAALEGLERERVGLAPAAARLLRERERFGRDAVLGPLSDFIGADTAIASQVERFLGATVHAVVVRDRAAADAVRAWHAEANPGALLLLPLDAASGIGSSGDADGLGARVRADGAAGGWVRALLGRVHATNDGNGFVDARGAVWLPAREAGAGPLRRRAELEELRLLLGTIEVRRAAVQATAQLVHDEVVRAETAASHAADETASAQQSAAQASATTSTTRWATNFREVASNFSRSQPDMPLPTSCLATHNWTKPPWRSL